MKHNSNQSASSHLQLDNNPHQQQSFDKLLVVMTDRHIGNLLISLYAIKSVHARLQEQQSIQCVIDGSLLSLAEYFLPEVTFIPFSLRGRNTSLTTKLRRFAALIRQLRREKFDTAVDLYGHSESWYLARLSGASYISAYYCKPKLKKRYHWCDLDSPLQPLHQLDYYLLPFLPVVDALQLQLLKAPQQAAVIADIRHKLTKIGVSEDKPLVLIHPGAGKAYKLWPSKHWQSLIHKLADAGKQVLLIGAGQDRQAVEAILADKRLPAINGFETFSLIETLQLGYLCQSMIGNDSGPTHLMATTPTQVFSLFGPTDHRLWAPLSDNSHTLRADQGCLDSCSKQRCAREISCLQALSPEMVYRQVVAAEQ